MTRPPGVAAAAASVEVGRAGELDAARMAELLGNVNCDRGGGGFGRPRPRSVSTLSHTGQTRHGRPGGRNPPPYPAEVRTSSPSNTARPSATACEQHHDAHVLHRRGARHRRRADRRPRHPVQTPRARERRPVARQPQPGRRRRHGRPRAGDGLDGAAAVGVPQQQEAVLRLGHQQHVAGARSRRPTRSLRIASPARAFGSVGSCADEPRDRDRARTGRRRRGTGAVLVDPGPQVGAAGDDRPAGRRARRSAPRSIANVA